LKSQFQLENNNKTLLHENIGVIILIMIIIGTRRTMLMPFRMPDEHRTSENGRVSREDFRRFLYPYHAQFWPEDIPEHIMFQEKSRRLMRAKRRAALRRILRFEWLLQTFRKPVNECVEQSESKSPETVCADFEEFSDSQALPKRNQIHFRKRATLDLKRSPLLG
jgi:hypothetical protein